MTKAEFEALTPDDIFYTADSPDWLYKVDVFYGNYKAIYNTKPRTGRMEGEIKIVTKTHVHVYAYICLKPCTVKIPLATISLKKATLAS